MDRRKENDKANHDHDDRAESRADEVSGARSRSKEVGRFLWDEWRTAVPINRKEPPDNASKDRCRPSEDSPNIGRPIGRTD